MKGYKTKAAAMALILGAIAVLLKEWASTDGISFEEATAAFKMAAEGLAIFGIRCAMNWFGK